MTDEDKAAIFKAAAEHLETMSALTEEFRRAYPDLARSLSDHWIVDVLEKAVFSQEMAKSLLESGKRLSEDG